MEADGFAAGDAVGAEFAEFYQGSSDRAGRCQTAR